MKLFALPIRLVVKIKFLAVFKTQIALPYSNFVNPLLTGKEDLFTTFRKVGKRRNG